MPLRTLMLLTAAAIINAVAWAKEINFSTAEHGELLSDYVTKHIEHPDNENKEPDGGEENDQKSEHEKEHKQDVQEGEKGEGVERTQENHEAAEAEDEQNQDEEQRREDEQNQDEEQRREDEQSQDEEQRREDEQKQDEKQRREDEQNQDEEQRREDEQKQDEEQRREDDDHKVADAHSHKVQDVRHWSYYGIYGPSNWSSLFKECGHQGQSPIDIDPKTTKLHELLMEVSLIFSHEDDDTVTMVNNGHTVRIAHNRTTFRLVGGGFGHTYRVIGVHFHWGRVNDKGSEHTILGKHFPLEMHIVSYNEDDYEGVKEALTSPDGLAVLGIIFEISEKDNEHFSPIVSHLKDVRVPGEPVSINYFDLNTLLPSNMKNFYRYQGSLTTPPCSESVVWTVFDTPQHISSGQLAEFRSLYEAVHSDGTEIPMLHNWRPVQAIGKRNVYRSFPLAVSVHGKSFIESGKGRPTKQPRPTAHSGAFSFRSSEVYIGLWITSILLWSFSIPIVD